MEKREYERICELANKLADGNPCVFADILDVPDTFAADMAALFGADSENDVLRNVIETYDEVEGYYCYNNLIVVPDTVESEELFVKLADYVNGLKIPYVFCCCKDKDGEYSKYEIDKGHDYVEGGCRIYFEEDSRDEGALTLDLSVLALGARDPQLAPNPIVESIKNGNHYVESLLGPDDEKLI